MYLRIKSAIFICWGTLRLYSLSALSGNQEDWAKLDIASEDLSAAKFVCKAVALSIGLPLVSVIDGFQKPFWDIGGSPLNAVMVVKMCHDGGFPFGTVRYK